MFFKIGVLKNFANFIGKHLCWSLFLIKSQDSRPVTLLNRDSNWNLRNFTEYLEAVSEERTEEELQNFPFLYDKGNGATKKKIRKRTHGLGCNMSVATTKLHKLNYKGNLDRLKRCSESFLWRLYLEKRLLCNSFEQIKWALTSSSFHNKKTRDQFKMGSTSKDFKGVCKT